MLNSAVLPGGSRSRGPSEAAVTPVALPAARCAGWRLQSCIPLC